MHILSLFVMRPRHLGHQRLNMTTRYHHIPLLVPTTLLLALAASGCVTAESDSLGAIAKSTPDADALSSSSGDASDSGDASESGTDGDELSCAGPPAGVCTNPSPYEGDGACDPYAQDCPQGERCVPQWVDGLTTNCLPVDPSPAQLGELCTFDPDLSGPDNCDVGLMCWGQGGQGICTPLCGCGPKDPTCPAATDCVALGPMGEMPVCLDTCDPLESDCAALEVCILKNRLFDEPTAGPFICVPDASGGASAGTPCEYVNVCSPGLACVPNEMVPDCPSSVWGCCAEYCDANDKSSCTDPETKCIPVFEPEAAPEACLERVGVCALPTK